MACCRHSVGGLENINHTLAEPAWLIENALKSYIRTNPTDASSFEPLSEQMARVQPDARAMWKVIPPPQL